MVPTRRDIFRLFADIPSFRGEYAKLTFESNKPVLEDKFEGTIDASLSSENVEAADRKAAITRRDFYQIGLSSIALLNRAVSHPVVSGALGGFIGGVGVELFKSGDLANSNLRIRTSFIQKLLQTGYHPEKLDTLSTPSTDGERAILEYTRSFEENNVAMLLESIKETSLIDANRDNPYVANYIRLRKAINCMLCGLFDQAAMYLGAFEAKENADQNLNVDFLVRRLIFTLHSADTESFTHDFGLQGRSPRMLAEDVLGSDITRHASLSERHDIYSNFGVNGCFVRYAQSLHDRQTDGPSYGPALEELEMFLHWSREHSLNHSGNLIDIWYQFPRLAMHAVFSGNIDSALEIVAISEGLFQLDAAGSLIPTLEARFQTNYIIYLLVKMIVSESYPAPRDSTDLLGKLRGNLHKITNPAIARAVVGVLQDRGIAVKQGHVAVSRSTRISSFTPVIDLVRIAGAKRWASI